LWRRDVEEEHDVVRTLAFELLEAAHGVHPVRVARLTLRRLDERMTRRGRMRACASPLIVAHPIEVRNPLLFQKARVLPPDEQVCAVGDTFESLAVRVG